MIGWSRADGIRFLRRIAASAGAASAPSYRSVPPQALSPMTGFRTAIAFVALLGSVARAQQPDTTVWAHLRYRFVGPEGNRAVAVAGEPGNSLVASLCPPPAACSHNAAAILH